jgi:hypothetical protein
MSENMRADHMLKKQSQVKLIIDNQSHLYSIIRSLHLKKLYIVRFSAIRTLSARMTWLFFSDSTKTLGFQPFASFAST